MSHWECVSDDQLLTASPHLTSGLAPDTTDEDNQHIRELVLSKMNAKFCSPHPTASLAAAVVEGGAGAAAEIGSIGDDREGARSPAPPSPAVADQGAGGSTAEPRAAGSAE